MTNLILPKYDFSSTDAFEGDLLDRVKLAETLTAYINRLATGAVIAIEGEWGEGKSWFGRNWAKSLSNEENKHQVIFIDAFLNDYIEDPFLLIASEITSAIPDKKISQRLVSRGVDVMKALAPFALKAGINVSSTLLLGKADMAEDMKEAIKSAADSGAESSEKWIKQKFEGYSQEKASIEKYIEELTTFAEKEKNPVVIFIDELDRCKPDFAVKLLERIKHFFDVPNIVFVLLINREQLESAIKGVYGEKTNAELYLGKFIQFFFRLPKNISTENAINSNSSTQRFIKNVMGRYDTQNTNLNVEDFIIDFSIISVFFNLSPRNIEHGCAIYIMSDTRRTALIAYLIALKLVKPSLYSKLEREDKKAHLLASEAFNGKFKSQNPSQMDYIDKYFSCVRDLHLMFANNKGIQAYPILKEFHDLVLLPRMASPKKTFDLTFEKLSLFRGYV